MEEALRRLLRQTEAVSILYLRCQGVGAGGNPARQTNSFNSLFEMQRVDYRRSQRVETCFNSLLEMRGDGAVGPRHGVSWFQFSIGDAAIVVNGEHPLTQLFDWFQFSIGDADSLSAMAHDMRDTARGFNSLLEMPPLRWQVHNCRDIRKGFNSLLEMQPHRFHLCTASTACFNSLLEMPTRDPATP